MDEWIDPQEEKGYETAEVVKNEFYEFTYKYKPLTRSLTDKIIEYIADVENDSVLYFMDSLPEEWMPTVGGCVVANCCPEFPCGLVRKVVNIEHINGMYKVVTVDAALEEAYDEFEFDMDTDLLTAKLDENGNSRNITRMANKRKTRGNDQPDSIIIDWTMYNLVTKGDKVKNVNGVATRALEDDYENEIPDEQGEEIKEIPILALTSDHIVIQTLLKRVNAWSQKKYQKNLVTDLEFNLSSITKTHIRKIVSFSKQQEYTKTENSSGYKLEGKVGSSAGSNDNIEEKSKKFKELEKELLNFYHNMGNEEELASKMKDIEKPKGFVFHFPLGASPLNGIITITPTIDGKFGLFFSGDLTVWTSKSIQETNIVQGKKLCDKTVSYHSLKEAKSKDTKLMDKLAVPDAEWNASLSGQFSFTVGGELFVGVGKVVADVPVGVGFFCSLTGTLGAEVGIKGGTNGGDVSSNDMIYLQGNLDIGAKAKAGSYIDWTLFHFPKELGKIPLVQYCPTIASGGNVQSITRVDDEGKPYMEYTYAYTFKDLGALIPRYMRGHYRPAIMVWKGTEIPEEDGDLFTPDENYTKVAPGEKYSFTYRTYNTGECVICPCLKYTLTGTYQRLKDNKKNVSLATVPKIRYITQKQSDNTYNHWYMLSGEEMNKNSELASRVDDPSKYYEFHFLIPFELYNATKMSDVWDDFGVYYEIRNGVTTLYENYHSLNIKKSGIYIPEIKFAVSKTGSLENVLKRINISGELFFTDKSGKNTRLYDNANRSVAEYTYKRYGYDKVDKYDEWLNDNYHPTGLEDHYMDYDWMMNADFVSVIAKNWGSGNAH